jgi:hypothetical protein
MGIFIRKPRKPRSFTYEPRYYDPSKDDKLRRRMRIKRMSRSKRRNKFTNLLYFAGLLLFALYIYNLLG